MGWGRAREPGCEALRDASGIAGEGTLAALRLAGVVSAPPARPSLAVGAPNSFSTQRKACKDVRG
jgi:hypothetical protein